MEWRREELRPKHLNTGREYNDLMTEIHILSPSVFRLHLCLCLCLCLSDSEAMGPH